MVACACGLLLKKTVRNSTACAKCTVRLIRYYPWVARLLLVMLLVLTVYMLVGLLPPHNHNLHHFRRSRDLKYYMEAINLLIQPHSACAGDVPVLTLVHSAPSRLEQRQVIRNTWGKHMRTYFVLGIQQENVTPVKTYFEADQYRDLLVFDLKDHYQNLTLKTMLMLSWVQKRCPHASFVFKTDDDVLVNPYMIDTVVNENRDAELIGHRVTGITPIRSEYQKWFLPRWLFPSDQIPEYLIGGGYFVRGNIIGEILTAAQNVPLINLEDVYLTYLVCKSALNIELVHDRRVAGYFRPWLPLNCAYWTRACLHSFTPEDMERAWRGIMIKQKEAKHEEVCRVFENVMYFISYFVSVY